ncbi:MAG: thiolase family protein [Desulfobacterales bacterium]|nr:thiolase family protein [Desulfobacterales bacterium]MBS3756283.1 thiolase family protein [Desulfobacterales bacterium]
MKEAYIVTSLRTPGCRRGKGAFAQTRPEDLLKTVINEVVEQTGLEKQAVEDIMVGCSFPEAEQGLNIGRVISQMCGFPDTTTGATVNRFCSSGLEAIALQAMRIKSGMCDVAIGGGIESMTIVPMGGNLPRPHPQMVKENADVYISMGATAENVANRYNVTREMQDEFAYHSQMKAANAKQKNLYKELVPTPATKWVEDAEGSWAPKTWNQDFDDGIRENTTMEGLGKLRPAFAANGSVTAGNSSQTTDGAAATLIMSEEAVKKYNVKPIARLAYYTVTGVRADEMGVGPAYAIPKLMRETGMKLEDVGIFEVNEAFASQAIYCLQQMGMYDEKSLWTSDSDKRIVNVNGGAIALGHPLGCTGAKLCSQLMTEMQARGVKWGVESMCIGGGMGAAGLFELME